MSNDDARHDTVITLSTIRLGMVGGARDWWRFEPLEEGAFALLRNEIGPAELHAAITGADGKLFQLNPNDRASRESDIPLRLEAAQSYQVWWTYDESVFTSALEDPQVLDQGCVIRVEQPHLVYHPPLREQIASFDEGKDFHARTTVREAVNYHILHRQVFYEGRENPIFDVTPASLRALFLVEFMQWYATHTHLLSANNMATLAHINAMIEASEHGLKDVALEKRARQLFDTPERMLVFEKFREYAWRCAATGILENLFTRSISMEASHAEAPPGGILPHTDAVMSWSDDDWYLAAEEVRRKSMGKKNGPAVHPHLQGLLGPVSHGVQEALQLHSDEQKLLTSYFESYLFGAALRNVTDDDPQSFMDVGPTRYRDRMAARTKNWDDTVEAVHSRARSLLERHARPDVFFVDLSNRGSQVLDGCERYVSAAAYGKVEWWTLLGEAEGPQPPAEDSHESQQGPWPFWAGFRARTKLLTELLKGKAKITKFLTAHLNAYDMASAQAQQLLGTLGRLELSLAGEAVSASRHVIRSEELDLYLRPDGAGGEVHVHLAGKRTSVVVRLVRETPDAMTDSGPSSVRRLTAAPTSGTYRVRVPAHHEDLRSFIKVPSFTTLAETLNVAVALGDIRNKESAGEKLWATFEVLKGVVAAVEPHRAALAELAPATDMSPLLKRAHSLAKTTAGLSTWLGRVAGVGKVYKGIQLLLSDDPDVGAALYRGRTVRAQLQRLEGAANIVAGTAEVVEIAGATASYLGIGEIVGFSTTALASFVITPLGVLMVVGGGLIAAGSALAFADSHPWDDRLMEIEKAFKQACEQEVVGRIFRVAQELDALLDQVPNRL